MTEEKDPTPMTPLSSSMLKGYHYDSAKRRLTVEYASGHRYSHDGVLPGHVEGLAKAKSAGAYFNSAVKPHFEAKKVEAKR